MNREFRDLQGKVAVITGGHRRIGLAISESLAAAGCHIVLSYHQNQADAESARQKITAHGVDCKALQVNLANIEEVHRFSEQASQAFAAVDILVNNAAIFPYEPLAEMTPEKWQEIMNINAKAPFFLALWMGQKMAAGKGGRIINIIDSFDQRPYVDYLSYCMSKRSLEVATQGLAQALAPKVTVNSVHPGRILPPESSHPFKQSDIPLQRMGQPKEIAAMVRFICSQATYSTGGAFYVDGGYHIAEH